MKNIILNNFALKVLSVICAIVLWLVVLNISDYTMTVKIDDIPVEKLNGDVLDELDQLYDVEKGDTVDIVIKGRRSVVSKLSAKDFRATADLSTMSITNTVQIFVEPVDKSLSEEISITYVDNTMSLILEDKVSQQFPIKVNVGGNAKDGYAVGDTSAVPNIITVEGPRSTVEKITDVTADVSINGRSESYVTDADVKICDAYGEPIVSDKMSLSHESVEVNVNIYPVKSVSVEVNIKGKPEEGYSVGEVIYQPQTAMIAGLPEDLEDITTIIVDDISVSGMNENLQDSVNLNDYLPDGVFVAQPNPELVVNVTIERNIEKTISLTSKDITLEGKKNGYTYALSLSDGFRIVISGNTGDVSDIDVAALEAVIDCTDLQVGANNGVTLNLTKKDGVEYEIIGEVTVTVKALN